MQKIRRREPAPLQQRSPELQAAFKGGINGHGFIGGDLTVWLHRGVVQLAIRGMACAGVVHRSGAL